MPEQKKHLKNSNFNMRIDPQLKADFAAITEQEDVSAGQALRAFMRRYVAKRRSNGKEGAKWDNSPDQRT